MTPIPEAAMPVVLVLRRDVRRPRSKPREVFGGMVRFPLPVEEVGRRWACPMGLHPKSDGVAPAWGLGFAAGACDSPAVRSFARWWDSLTLADAPEALDAIWPRTA